MPFPFGESEREKKYEGWGPRTTKPPRARAVVWSLSEEGGTRAPAHLPFLERARARARARPSFVACLCVCCVYPVPHPKQTAGEVAAERFDEF